MSSTSKYNKDVLSNVDDDKNEKKTPFPYEITKLDDERNMELMKSFPGERTGFVQVGPKKWLFPSGYEYEAQNYYNFEVRPDDIFIVTFPRSGTTLTQEMVWLLTSDLNYQKAAEISLQERFPFLEISCFVHKETKAEFLKENAYDGENYKYIQNYGSPEWQTLAAMTGRRFIKTHLPFSLLPPNLLDVGVKVIYLARNPKDVAVSFYHLNRLMRIHGYTGDFPKYWDYFERNLLPWTPYWEHLKEGWNCRNEKNMLFLFYEDINKDLRGTIETVSRFLGKNYPSKEYDALVNHLKIDNFRTNRSVNLEIINNLGIAVSGEEGFIRKGGSDGWKNYFDKQLNVRANKWIEENLKDTDLRFPNVAM